MGRSERGRLRRQLLNDCKYGYDIAGNVMRLTALKGAMFPDPDADLSEHHFTYSLLPHTGDWRNGTVPAAYGLNNPLIVHLVQGTPQGASEAGQYSLVHVDAPQIIVETVKQAEDGDGLIVRLYEHERTQQVFDLHGVSRWQKHAAVICSKNKRNAWT